jgi:hypothetical protein
MVPSWSTENVNITFNGMDRSEVLFSKLKHLIIPSWTQEEIKNQNNERF